MNKRSWYAWSVCRGGPNRFRQWRHFHFMIEAGMRNTFRRLVGIGVLGLGLIGPATGAGRAETGKDAETDGSEQLQRDQAEAQELLQRLAWQPHDEGNIALLNGDWPGQNRAVIDALAAALRQAGYQPTLLDAPAFLNPFVVSPERFDLLIITGGRELPVETAPTLAGFLKHQGNLIAIGTPLYADPVRRVNDGWMKPADIRAKLDAVQPTRVLDDFESDSPAGWTRSSNKMDNPVTFTCADEGAGGSKRSLHVTIDDLVGWETFAGPPLPRKHRRPRPRTSCVSGPRAVSEPSGWRSSAPNGMAAAGSPPCRWSGNGRTMRS